jgi:hypothetical protein
MIMQPLTAAFHAYLAAEHAMTMARIQHGYAGHPDEDAATEQSCDAWEDMTDEERHLIIHLPRCVPTGPALRLMVALSSVPEDIRHGVGDGRDLVIDAPEDGTCPDGYTPCSRAYAAAWLYLQRLLAILRGSGGVLPWPIDRTPFMEDMGSETADAWRAMRWWYIHQCMQNAEISPGCDACGARCDDALTVTANPTHSSFPDIHHRFPRHDLSIVDVQPGDRGASWRMIRLCPVCLERIEADMWVSEACVTHIGCRTPMRHLLPML